MKRFLLFFILIYAAFVSIADEGMWIPIFLEDKGIIDRMRKAGCNLTAQDIYNENTPSLKDAVVIFGGGCTGEVVSPQGLVLTNYHCGYGAIQRHSTVENDYLTNGFWAMSQREELPNPGLTVTFLIKMEDVTDKILSGIDENTNEKNRQLFIETKINELKREAKNKYGKEYDYEIKPFYGGNMYILLVYQIFRDIRLVGAPPSAIGKFGGDTDNWMWPRHTGDFSIFRIYADKNNQPADYSPDNVPFKPKKFLKINIGGIQEGDFTMVIGYPGTTEEYLPSYAIRQKIKVINPLRIKIRDKKLEIINSAMAQSPELRIKYAAKQASIANGWKKWIGENKGIKRLQVIKQKQNFEKEFQKWTLSKPPAKKYVNLLSDFRKYYGLVQPSELAYYMWLEAFYFSDLRKIYTVFAKNNFPQLSKNEKKEFVKKFSNIFKDFDKNIERELFAVSFDFYMNSVEDRFKPVLDIENANYKQYAYNLFDNSQITDYKKLKLFVEKSKSIADDPLLSFYSRIFEKFRNVILTENDMYVPSLDSLNRLYMRARIEMFPQKVFYSDANFTMRIAFGHIKGFAPADAIYYEYFTTLNGVMQKDNPEIYDYKVPEKLKKLYYKKDFGRYSDKKELLHVAFIADNHTTGGNSGSPVLDRNGNLIGINFDRVWEGTMSDLKFDPEMCRNITLDIRYVLFIIDKYAGASYLIDEMTLIQKK